MKTELQNRLKSILNELTAEELVTQLEELGYEVIDIEKKKKSRWAHPAINNQVVTKVRYERKISVDLEGDEYSIFTFEVLKRPYFYGLIGKRQWTWVTDTLSFHKGFDYVIDKCKNRLDMKTEYKGQLEGFPKEVVERMLDHQEEQGDKRDVAVFEGLVSIGFVWEKTIEGENFWRKVILFKDFDLFFKKYPKEEDIELEIDLSKVNEQADTSAFDRVGEKAKLEEWFPRWGNSVFVRDNDSDEWGERIFIAMNPDEENHFKYVVGQPIEAWRQCKKFEEELTKRRVSFDNESHYTKPFTDEEWEKVRSEILDLIR